MSKSEKLRLAKAIAFNETQIGALRTVYTSLNQTRDRAHRHSLQTMANILKAQNRAFTEMLA